jgi:uncharacterized lipoprotein YajG
MKKVMFALAFLPLLAACWSKKDKVETVATEVMPEQEPVVNPEEMPSEDMPGMADNVSAEMSDEK